MSLVKSRKRKSPFKHDVKNHVRKGRPVVQYERGKGDQAKKSKRKSRVVGGGSNSSSSVYDVTIIYDGSSERFDVDARNYLGALGGGLSDRDRVDSPSIVRMRRGSLGE